MLCQSHLSSVVCSTTLDDYIGRPHVVKVTELTEKLVSYLHSLGITEIKPHTNKHIRRKLDADVGSSLYIFSSDKDRLLIMPDNLSTEKIAKYCIKMKDRLDMFTRNDTEMEQLLLKAALHLRSKIKEAQHENPWPPCPNEMDDKYVDTPSPQSISHNSVDWRSKGL